MRTSLNKPTTLLVLAVLPLMMIGCPSPTPPVVFEQYENNAIQMVPQSISMEFETAKPTTYQTILPTGASGKIYPRGQVTFRYELRNLTDKNYRFEVCLGWEKQAIGCDTVTFIGQTSNILTHSAALSPGSGPLQVSAPNILIDAGSNDVRPLYYWATLEVANACGNGEKCCHYSEDGSCPECIANDGTQQCQ